MATLLRRRIAFNESMRFGDILVANRTPWSTIVTHWRRFGEPRRSFSGGGRGEAPSRANEYNE